MDEVGCDACSPFGGLFNYVPLQGLFEGIVVDVERHWLDFLKKACCHILLKAYIKKLNLRFDILVVFADYTFEHALNIRFADLFKQLIIIRQISISALTKLFNRLKYVLLRLEAQKLFEVNIQIVMCAKCAKFIIKFGEGVCEL